MSALHDAIRLRLNELIKARTEYKTETDRHLMGYDSAIGELTELLRIDDNNIPQPQVAVTSVTNEGRQHD
jgi:hypothetical protein